MAVDNSKLITGQATPINQIGPTSPTLIKLFGQNGSEGLATKHSSVQLDNIDVGTKAKAFSLNDVAGGAAASFASGLMTSGINLMLGWNTDTTGGRLGQALVDNVGGAAIQGVASLGKEALKGSLSTVGKNALKGAVGGLKNAFSGAGGISMASNMLNSTLFGNTRGFGKGYKLVQAGVGFIPGVGQGLSAAMAVGDLVNNALGKKTATMSKNNDIWAGTENSYGNSAFSFDQAMNDQGVRYGALQSKARHNADQRIYQAGRDLWTIGNIVGQEQTANLIVANQTDMAGNAYNMQMQGGYNQAAMHSAKNGAKLQRAKRIISSIKIKNQFLNNLDDSENNLTYCYPIFLEDVVKDAIEENTPEFKNGGLINVIPEGALHKNKHHLEDENPELDGEITTKGIPVITKEGGEIIQHAEIERNEIIFCKEVTDKLESWYKEYKDSETSQQRKDELAIKAGKLLAKQIIENTDDRTGLIEEVNE